jgi:hypothetical protein
MSSLFVALVQFVEVFTLALHGPLSTTSLLFTVAKVENRIFHASTPPSISLRTISFNERMVSPTSRGESGLVLQITMQTKVELERMDLILTP